MSRCLGPVCVAGYHVAVMEVSSQLSPHTGRGMEQNTKVPGLSASLFFPSPTPSSMAQVHLPLSASTRLFVSFFID